MLNFKLISECDQYKVHTLTVYTDHRQDNPYVYIMYGSSVFTISVS